jgi:hypothetical protein
MIPVATNWLEEQLNKWKDGEWVEIPLSELKELLDRAAEIEIVGKEEMYTEGWRGAEDAIVDILLQRKSWRSIK